MIEQAAGLAALAAIYPPALLLIALYLESEKPGRTLGFYFLGALVMTAIIGVGALLAIRVAGLSIPTHRQPRYGLRLGLGVIALAAGIYLFRRGTRPPKPKKPGKKPGIIERLTAHPSPLSAFVVGVLTFGPSLGFLAAVQVIATSRASNVSQAVALVLVVAIDVVLVWVPLILYLLAPDRTVRALKASNAWLRAHQHTIFAGGLTAIGIILMIDGIVHLA